MCGDIMTVFNETIFELVKNGNVDELYRFQGYNSKHMLDLKNDGFSLNNDDKYFYFSKSLSHHKYFMVKRIRQLVNYILLETPYDLSSKYIRSNDDFNNITKFVFNSDKIKNLNSMKFVYDSSYYKLIKDNACYNDENKSGYMVERVDRRVFGGGYGISKEWLKLLEILTFFYSYVNIDESCIKKILKNMKINGNVTSLYNVDFLNFQNYKLNPLIFNNFTKYQIIEYMEQIVENNLVLKGSELEKYPSKSIKATVDSYHDTREKVLTLFENHYFKL